MTKEEKINKILEMSKEIVELVSNNAKDIEINLLYINTKSILEKYKEIYGIEEGNSND